MGVERSVTNIFHPNLTIFDENNNLGCILADAEKLFLNVYVFVPIFSLVGLLAIKALIYGNLFTFMPLKKCALRAPGERECGD